MVFPVGFPHGISVKLVLHISFAPEKPGLLEFHFLVQPKNEDTENTVDLLCFLWKQESLTLKTHQAGMIGHPIPNHRLDV